MRHEERSAPIGSKCNGSFRQEHNWCLDLSRTVVNPSGGVLSPVPERRIQNRQFTHRQHLGKHEPTISTNRFLDECIGGLSSTDEWLSTQLRHCWQVNSAYVRYDLPLTTRRKSNRCLFVSKTSPMISIFRR